MPSEWISTPQQRTPPGTSRPSASGTSSWSPPDAIKRAVSLSLTTTVFNQRSTGWFSAHPRKADAGGPTSLHLSHSTAYERCLLHDTSFDVRDTRGYPSNSGWGAGGSPRPVGGRSSQAGGAGAAT